MIAALDTLLKDHHRIIAGYWPIAHELDCREILSYYHKERHTCLPVVTSPQLPLIFREYSPGDTLVKQGTLPVLEPLPDK